MKDRLVKNLKRFGAFYAFLLLAQFIARWPYVNNMDWYQDLQKPPLTPPSWVFAIAWSSIYILMSASAALLYRKLGSLRNEHFYLFFVQLALNIVWQFVFFEAQELVLSSILVIIIALIVIITSMRFWQVSKIAGWLFIPYIMWLTFAYYLSLKFALLND